MKIAPGEDGHYWAECLAGGYICVGWDEVGDLRGYQDEASFRAAFRSSYPYPSAAKGTEKAAELWLLRDLRPGDLVVANKGIDEILAVGKVREPGYVWRQDRSEFRHTVAVDWDTSVARPIAPIRYWAFKTVLELTEDEFASLESAAPPRPVAEIVRSAIASAGLAVDDTTADDVYLSLRTKPFLILTGLSGTGKTKIALRVCELLCDRDTWELVSVRPDWSDARGLLGFYNLLTERYQTTPVAELLVRAADEWKTERGRARPFGLVLDEMNLARVEHYFSDFLGALESRRLDEVGVIRSEPIVLHDRESVLSADERLSIPGRVEIPPNFFIVGTVNVDESTQPFSRKVLDRANTIELFDVDLRRSGQWAGEALSSRDRRRAREHFSRDGTFLDLAQPSLDTPWLGLLVDVNRTLEFDRLHFGYRVRNEILAFIAQAGDEGLLGAGDASSRTAADLQVTQKVLPKLSGSREQLQRPLLRLLEVALGPGGPATIEAMGDRYEHLYALLSGRDWMDRANDEPMLDEGEGDRAALALPAGIRLPRTARKIARMLVQLKTIGYTSFFE